MWILLQAVVYVLRKQLDGWMQNDGLDPDSSQS
jgi:hypothetical protein